MKVTGSLIGGAILAIALPVSASAATLAQWNMGETSGSTMHDASGNGHDGAISGVTLGKKGHDGGKAYGFTGNDGVVRVPSTKSLNTGSGSFSVSLFFKSSTKPPKSVEDYDLIRKGAATTSGGDWKMEVLDDGHVFCHFHGKTATVDLKGTTNVITGSWHRLECKYSTSGTSLVVDGATQAKSSKIPGSVANTAALTVGAKDSGGDTTTATLDGVTLTKS